MRADKATPKRPKSHDDLARLLDELPPGRRRVVERLVGGPVALTYPEVAASLGVHVGTVHRHLRRLRDHHPDLAALVAALRREQLADRHALALSRAVEHSRRWWRRVHNRRYRERFGRYPWERRG